jgi:uncharacterized membrane-anchored protein YhcB (DUF1043 family)
VDENVIAGLIIGLIVGLVVGMIIGNGFCIAENKVKRRASLQSEKADRREPS